MAFHDDLLRQAIQLVHKESKHPKQASLRRAVSTAYYAMFHFLIWETTANWSRHALRARLGRAFDHAPMKSASNRILDSRMFPFTGEDPTVVANLKTVAKAFAQLQEKRHTADYDNGASWIRTEALTQDSHPAESTCPTARFQPANNPSLSSAFICGSKTRSARQKLSTSVRSFQNPVASPAR